MVLAKWARMEEPTPGSLTTRKDVDEWLCQMSLAMTLFIRYWTGMYSFSLYG